MRDTPIPLIARCIIVSEFGVQRERVEHTLAQVRHHLENPLAHLEEEVLFFSCWILSNRKNCHKIQHERASASELFKIQHKVKR